MYEPGQTSATMEQADLLAREIADLFQTTSITVDRPEVGLGHGLDSGSGGIHLAVSIVP